jgi:hypothetical protein
MGVKMSHQNQLVVIAVLSLFLAGCAGKTATNSIDYVKPIEITVDNQVVVTSDYDKTWSDLVGEMSKSFYVINNIDKESRLINLSFSITNNISDYVDCGISNRSFMLGDMNENVSYKTADESEYYSSSTANSAPPNTTYFKVFRSPSLEGRANVYVAPKGEGTLVTVNTRYSWNVKIFFEEYMYMPLYNSYNLVRNKKLDTNNIYKPNSFNTSGIGVSDSTTCVATGKFEQQILDIIRE